MNSTQKYWRYCRCGHTLFWWSKIGCRWITRAYSGATESVLAELPLIMQRAMIKVSLVCEFSQEQDVRYWVVKHEAVLGEPVYGEKVSLCLDVPEEQLGDLRSFCEAKGISLCDIKAGLLDQRN